MKELRNTTQTCIHDIKMSVKNIEKYVELITKHLIEKTSKFLPKRYNARSYERKKGNQSKEFILQ